MKAYTRDEVLLHAFLTSALNGGDSLLYGPTALPGKKNPRNLLDRTLNGPQSRSKFSREQKSLLLIEIGEE
jgi:hypothetical protein